MIPTALIEVPVSISPSDAEMFIARRFGPAEISRHYGVPVTVIALECEAASRTISPSTGVGGIKPRGMTP